MSNDGEEAAGVENLPPSRFNHDQKLETKLTQSLLDVGDELDCEVLLDVITWDQYDDLSGWDPTSPNVRYNLPPRRRKPPTQDDSNSSSQAGNGKRRCYELDFVDAPAWKICVEPTTYRYLANNGRYRASKLVKKLEIQKCVRKTCAEKLSPEQRHLQREIQRELRKEFETYLQMEKQKQIALYNEKQEQIEAAENTEHVVTQSEGEDESLPIHSDYSSHSTLNEQQPSSVNTDSNNRPLYRSGVQKDLELPPIKLYPPTVKTVSQSTVVKRGLAMRQENDAPSAPSDKVFQKSHLVIEGQTVESDSDGDHVPKTRRSMSEPPPPHFNGKIDNSSYPVDQNVGDPLCQSEPQTHRRETEARNSPAGKLSYSQSLCDLGKQPTHNVPAKLDNTLGNDMIQVKPITTAPSQKGRHDPETNFHWDLNSSRPPDSNNQTVNNAPSAYQHTSDSHPSINSAPAHQSRRKNSLGSGKNESFGMTLLTSKFSSQSTSNTMNAKTTPYRASLAAAKKAGKLKNKSTSHGVKPTLEPDVSGVVPGVIPVPHAFHSVPINKSRPRSKKQTTSPPTGLLPEIAGHKIAVSLTTQKYL